MRSYAAILFFLAGSCFNVIAQDNDDHFIEKIYLHTDKSLYHAGELLWFRMFVADTYFHKPVNLSKVGYVELLEASGHPVLQGKIALDSLGGSGSFLVPATIASGKYILRGYTRWMKNFGPALFFNKEITVINVKIPNGKQLKSEQDDYPPVPGKKLQLNMSTDKPAYRSREKVTLQLSAASGEGNPVVAYASVAVSAVDSLNSGSEKNITDYFRTSEVQLQNAVIQYPPEFRGHIVEGTIKDKRTNLPAAGVRVYLSIPGHESLFRTSISDSSGRIKFELDRFHEGGEMIVQADPLRGDYTIAIQSPFSPVSTLGTVLPFVLPATNPVTLLKQDMSSQVQQVYTSAEMRRFVPLVKDTSAFYGNEDVVYLLDNYTRFKTMEEVFREYVQPVGVTRRAGRFHTYIFDQYTRRPFAEDPLVLLDGVPIFDADKLMGYDPLKVERINIVAKKYFHGLSSFSGIVSMHTYKGNVEGYELDSGATVLDYEGLQLNRKFYSPAYETAQQRESHLPDYRNVLYWSPEIVTGASGKAVIEFYTSDLPGRYEVNLQAVTADGSCGWGKIIFTVD